MPLLIETLFLYWGTDSCPQYFRDQQEYRYQEPQRDLRKRDPFAD